MNFAERVGQFQEHELASSTKLILQLSGNAGEVALPLLERRCRFLRNNLNSKSALTLIPTDYFLATNVQFLVPLGMNNSIVRPQMVRMLCL
jgi:hypothetical protein